jgi:radical SAM protein with 4Fe4S-binding SPASM domain
MTFDLAMEATKWLIKQAEANGKTPSINYFGGEPLLKYDQIIYPLTKWIREEYKKPFNLGITTNSILLDRDKMDFFKQNSVGMLFSIDGDKEIQDRNRPLKNGGSSFDILKDKIPMVLEYYPNMTFRATFDHDDKDIMARVHKFAIEQGYNNIFHIPNNLADWTEEEKEHLKQQMHDLADYWMDLFREGKTIDFQPFGKAINYIYRINTMDERKGHRDEVRGIGYGKCGTGATGFASVSPEGKLYSCQEIVGNLNGHAETYCICDIWNGTNEERRFELASQFNVLDVHSGREGRCNDCILTISVMVDVL